MLTSFANPAQWLLNWVRGSWEDDESSRKVTSEAALSYAPIWYGVNKIAGHIAQLPIGVFQRVERGGERKRGHQTARILRRPNAYQTASIFREQLATHSLLEGNGRAAIVRTEGGAIAELIPLHPDCTATGMIDGVKIHATRPSADDRLRRFFADVDGEAGNGTSVIMLDDAEVLHVLGLSLDGICGIPLRDIAKRNLNAAIDTEKRFAKGMAQGFSGSLMIEAPTGVFRSEDDAKKFLEHFEKRHNSPEKAGKPGLLREGMKANILQSSNRESELTDNRKFQRQDAALWLGLEQILGDDSSVSYNSLEQKNLAYLMNCLNRWLKRWEEEIEAKLLPTRQFRADSHYVRFNTAALLKSDYKTSVESLGVAIASRIISPNEAREKLDLLPYDGGDSFENPNITPGAGGATEESDQTTTSTNEATDATANSEQLALTARVEHLIKVEANKVKQAAQKASDGGKNFLEWVDSHYAKWEPKLANWFEEIGIDRDLATQHCAESTRRLLDVCDYSKDDTLAENVAKACGSWPARAANVISEGSTPKGETANV